jgi:hypothetical protein
MTFLLANIAAAGLPPTSTKSQLDTSKSTTFDFQAPFNQFTKPSGTTALIETGNKNLLKDPGFESSDPTAVWVIALAGTVSRTSTAANVGSGSYALSYDAAATNGTVTSAAVAVPNGFIGKTLEASCDIKNTSAGLYKIQAYDGTNVLAEQLITTDSTYYVRNTLRFPSPTSGSISIRFLAGTAGEPVFYIDDCYLGIDRGQGSTQLISEWVSYTPSIGLTGGSTTAYGKYRQNGTNVEVQFDATFTTVFTGGVASVSIPSACSEIDTTQLPTGYATGVGLPNSNARLYDVGTGQWGGSIVYNDTTSVLMRTWTDDVGAGGNHVQVDAAISTTIPFTWANNDRVSGSFTVPCTAFKAQTTASIDAISKRGSIYFASGSATNTGAVAAFNVAGFGTNTLEGQALAPTTANDLGIRMTGAPAGTYEVQATGRFYVSSAATTGTRTVCNYSLYDGTSTRGDVYALAPGGLTAESNDGIGSLTGQFVLSSAGTINVVVRGQRVTGNGTCYAEGPVSISIKNVSQNSPAIVIANSVSTGTVNGDKIGRATVANSGSASITSQSTGFLSSVSYVSTGLVDTFFSTGYFSAAPSCTCTARLGGRLCAIDNTTPPSISGARFWTGLANTAAEANVEFQIICVGPR